MTRWSLRLAAWARALRRDVHAVWLAARDPRVPWPAKAVALFVAAYALSPIDPIPDFIPIVGLLDELLVVPAGLWLVTRLVPPALMAEHRTTAAAAAERPKSLAAAAVIIAAWIAIGAAIAWLAYRALVSM